MQRFVDHTEKAIASSSIILSSNIQKQFDPDNETVYLKGNLLFIDSSSLEIAFFAEKSGAAVSLDKYRLHYMDKYMDKEGAMIFRYDNAPHHRELSSFPHHKHTPDNVAPSSMPSIKNVLNEISAIIIQNKK